MNIKKIRKKVLQAVKTNDEDIFNEVFNEMLSDAKTRLTEYCCSATFAPENVEIVINWMGEPVTEKVSILEQVFYRFVEDCIKFNPIESEDLKNLVDYFGIVLAVVKKREEAALVELEKSNGGFA